MRNSMRAIGLLVLKAPTIASRSTLRSSGWINSFRRLAVAHSRGFHGCTYHLAAAMHEPMDRGERCAAAGGPAPGCKDSFPVVRVQCGLPAVAQNRRLGQARNAFEGGIRLHAGAGVAGQEHSKRRSMASQPIPRRCGAVVYQLALPGILAEQRERFFRNAGKFIGRGAAAIQGGTRAGQEIAAQAGLHFEHHRRQRLQCFQNLAVLIQFLDGLLEFAIGGECQSQSRAALLAAYRRSRPGRTCRK